MKTALLSWWRASAPQWKEIINKEEKIKLLAKQRRRGWVLYCLSLSLSLSLSPPPNTTVSLSLSISLTVLGPKATLRLCCLLFLCFLSLVYVCCFCSLFSIPANGRGIILCISCFYFIIFLLSLLLLLLFYFFLLIF